ncbi:dihydrofolate reductase [Epilithonimonas ginsengisoli]|uniref:Dihydrofolate reductase n=1 Tax=Epilithonimonas ginsengisoli TaxID=1245592 RepID=A0ABU4JI90_9FLAO|nr:MULTISPECIES: dihydrofolate reductase [Chryseobacterium group]MBV6879939.1 dihydrofolate reductase [Epilithonimonas sp. FP105]MDW8549386.1 dihydrofolate reductase [Epilithonimonas ginsengisoli]OAH70269.1 dihydrofolate reductase [Chryseobacterium sp. FP211-J200]
MITIIAAIGKNNALGKDNQLLWRLPKDLKHFKSLTENHPIVMGRKTYESIGKALPNRTNLVVSRKENWFAEDILIVSKLKEAIKFAKKIDEEVFIIGGGEIYKQTMELADRLEITLVEEDFEADTFFPKIDLKIWQKTSEEFHPKDEKNDHDFYFQTYEKIIKD